MPLLVVMGSGQAVMSASMVCVILLLTGGTDLSRVLVP